MKKFSSPLLLVLSLLLLLLTANSWPVFNYPPRSVHQWRQSDCAAYVKTYYRNGTGLFTPGTFYLGGKDGRVVSEFPILYYLAAKIEKITGEHYWVVRGLTFLCFVLGLMALLGCIRFWVRSTGFAVFPVLLLASSPYFYYYAINFLPNVPAISSSFVGLYFFLHYERSKGTATLVAGTAAFALATALKPTDGGLLWMAYLCTYACRSFFAKTQLRPAGKPVLMSAAVVAASVVAWTAYVNGYNDANGNHQNLVGIYPFWEMDGDLLRYTFHRVVLEWSHVFQQWTVHLFLAGCAGLCLWHWKRLNPFLKTLTSFLFLGNLAYSLLWFKAFTDHDYYQLPNVLPAVFLVITAVEYWVRVQWPLLRTTGRMATVALMIGLVAISFYHNRNVQRNRYTSTVERVVNPVLYEMEPYLESIGVRPNDAVVCVPDASPNTSLNAINRWGYTEIFYSEEWNINAFQKAGAAYLIVADSSRLTWDLYKPFTKKQVGEYKGVLVFDIRK